jgi:hypothetical protein
MCYNKLCLDVPTSWCKCYPMNVIMKISQVLYCTILKYFNRVGTLGPPNYIKENEECF